MHCEICADILLNWSLKWPCAVDDLDSYDRPIGIARPIPTCLRPRFGLHEISWLQNAS